MNLEGLSVLPLVAELDEKLRGGRIDKVYQPDKHTLVLHIRQYGETMYLLLSAHPEKARVHLATAIPDNPKTAPSFCMLLRKHLEDGRIAAISQYGLDRIVVVEIDLREENGQIVSKKLIAEIIGRNSNIVVLKDDIILDAIRHVTIQQSRYRQILPGLEYICPPPKDGIAITTATDSQFIAKIQENPTIPLAKALISACIGIGSLTAQEICWRAGLVSDITVLNLDNKDYHSLCEAKNSIITSLLGERTTPTVAIGKNNKMKGIAAFTIDHLADTADLKSFATMSAALEFVANRERPDIPNADILQKAVASEITKAKKKIVNLEDDIETANHADELKKSADILMVHLYEIRKGMNEISLPDIYDENVPQPYLTINLNPELTAIENAQLYYTKYNKMKRGLEQLMNQLSETHHWLDYLATIEVSLSQVSSNQEVEEIRQELAANHIIKSQHKKRPSKQGVPMPLKITLDEDISILIGKNNRQNDYLTFKLAHADDVWLHAKDIPGSHVIIKTSEPKPSDAVLMRAASLAAYYSKARTSTNVAVDYTKRRYVKKPSGAKPGFVIYDHYKTLFVNPEK